MFKPFKDFFKKFKKDRQAVKANLDQPVHICSRSGVGSSPQGHTGDSGFETLLYLSPIRESQHSDLSSSHDSSSSCD